MERLLSELVEKLHKAHGDRLVSVVLYGSAAGNETDRFSDYNVLCVLRQVTPLELSEAEPVFRWWREMKNPAPLLLSETEVRTSSDCFPIEFSDIKARHRILFGPDLVADIEVDYVFYRAHVEHELRAKLLRLRQKAGGMLSEADLLLRLMADSVSTFCVLFRHALILGGEPARYQRRDVIHAAHEKFGIAEEPFLTLLALREEPSKKSGVQAGALFREYLENVQMLVDQVDRLER